MKVYLTPGISQTSDSNGIGRVVRAQYRYLPELGVQFVDDEDAADVVACHAATAKARQVDVLHCHGLYFADVPHLPYASWHFSANERIAEAARQALEITVPSDWVGQVFRRDMRILPWVIPHGIEPDEWSPPDRPSTYVLWNKNRGDDVCDPLPAWELAKRLLPVISTFAPKHREIPSTMHVTGARGADEMREMIRMADVYLATTLETFGIGTLEAMACGVPVLGYDWGGTHDLVKHKETGYLVQPGDFDGLQEGYFWIQEHREQLSSAARATALRYTWQNAIHSYYQVLESAAGRSRPDTDVAVVITCYNYGRWVAEAVRSVLDQTYPAAEIVVVDDGSTDDSLAVLRQFDGHKNVKVIPQVNAGVAAARNNGIAACSAPLVVCLDADDMLHPDYLRVCVDAISRDRSLGVVYTGLKIINENGSDGPGTTWPPDFDWAIQSSVSNPPANCIPSAAMFRRKMWERSGGYLQRYAPGEDTEFWTRGLSLGFSAQRVTNENLFWYRGHEGSASRTKIYREINDDKPWMTDGVFPLGAPSKIARRDILSYAQPLISVILPVGPGHTGYVRDAIESVLAQSYRNWELVLIDDTIYTKDNHTLTEFGEGALGRFPFARYFANLGRSGAGAARNLGVQKARGKLVLFLDSDDYLQPNAMESMLDELLRAKAERYVYSDWWLDDGGLEVRRTPEFQQSSYVMQHAVTVLIARADVLEIGGFDEDLPCLEDHDLFLRLQIAGRCGVRVPRPLLTYRIKLGQRRESDAFGETAELLRSKYARYFGGGDKMTPCCGGSAAADILILAKRRLTAMTDNPTSALGDGKVRLEYIGQNSGSVTFTVKGRSYRGGRNPISKFVDSDPADVEFLLATGKWQRVERPAPPPVVQSAADVKPASEPALLEDEFEADAPLADPVEPLVKKPVKKKAVK